MLLNDLPKGVIQDICSLNNIIVGNERIVPIEQKNQRIDELKARICGAALSTLLKKYGKNSASLANILTRDQMHDVNHLVEIEEGSKMPLLLEDRFACARVLKERIGSTILSLLLKEHQESLVPKTRPSFIERNGQDSLVYA
ncbi:TPA: hypothetical protein DCZ36_03965 [Candidatus Gracilibacteria bacterium]|nr:hypothetical protein [Candidatus Gracilibacteria bacterium]